jgi:amino acid adenylation domain-containing protein
VGVGTGLSPAKRALLERWRAGDGSTPSSALPRRSPDRVVPLSYPQERFWILQQLHPATGAFNLSFCARLGVALDEALLDRAVDVLVDRQAALRTVLRAAEDGPVQAIDGGRRPVLEVVDLRTSPEDARGATALRQATAAVQQPFDLEAGPLARLVLFRLDDERSMLTFVIHHAAGDGWSLGVALADLARAYDALASGRAPALPALEADYADYAAHQRAEANADAWDGQVEWWRARLDGVPRLDLPLDRPRPRIPTLAGRMAEVRFGGRLSALVRTLARDEGVTVFMVLLAAYQTLLHRLTGQDDVAVGCPVANRPHAETHGLVGVFINVLPFRIDLAGDPTFRGLLQRVRGVCLGAYAHQDVPLEKLVSELQPERELNRTPFFQALFVLQNSPMPEMVFAGSPLDPVELEWATARHDVELHLWDGRQITGRLQCNTDVFGPETIDRMADQLHRLVSTAAADPDARLSELPLVSRAEEHRMLWEWNDIATCVDVPESLDQLLERSARAAPDAIALLDGARRTTYRELDQAANALAHRLVALGVGPEAVVGILAERGTEAILAMMAVLKAGGAYLPLDTVNPPDRLALLVGDAGACLVLAQPHLLTRLGPVDAAVEVLEPLEASRASATPPAVRAGARNAAYVMYTSGSTGRPKAVVHEHGAVLNQLASMAERLHLPAGGVVLNASSLAFDISTSNVYLAFLRGAPLALTPAGEVADPAALRRQVEATGTVMTQLTPSLWRLLITAGWQGRDDFVAVAGGEPAPPELWRELSGRSGAAWNAYGPTEVAVWVSFGRAGPPAAQPPSLGSPLGNTQVHVLERTLRLAPVGVTGEVYVGGRGLARGYLDRPALTAERFVPDPFSVEPGARLYATGDLGRRRADGTVEFLGRADRQVKVRGFRVELGEVEVALRSDPAVAEAVVVLDDGGDAGARLTAYVVPATADLDVVEVRRRLRRQLPEHMVPTEVRQLDELPLNRNGKVDVRALPPSPGVAVDPKVTPPRTPTERAIAAVWQDALGIDAVSIDADFFDVGGHSIVATQVATRLREALGVEIPLAWLFESPTVAGLAERIAEGVPALEGRPPVVALPRVPWRSSDDAR